MPNTGGVTLVSSNAQVSTGVITTGAILNGTILNVDIDTAAAIAISKLSGVAASGANSDITSLSALSTALSVAQGGIGVGTLAANGILYGNNTGAILATAVGTVGQVLTSNGVGVAPTFQAAPANWTYINKLTFANSSTQQNFSSIPAHDEFKLIFYIYNESSDIFTMNIGVNDIAGSNYTYFNVSNAALSYINNAAAWRMGYYQFAALLRFFATTFISGKKINDIINMHSNFSLGAASEQGSRSGFVTATADVSKINIIPTNPVTGTIELWYRDKK